MTMGRVGALSEAFMACSFWEIRYYWDIGMDGMV